MPTYQVETDDGTYEVELDGDLPEGPAGERLLQRLLQQQSRQPPRPPTGYANDAQALLGMGKQVLGGVRDAAQGLLDLPSNIANVITEYISPDAPGGPRRRVVPKVQSPQLPDVDPPQSGVEKAVRFGGQLLGDAAGAMLLPPIRHGVASLARKLRPGATLGKELMFEPGHTAREIAERQMRKPQLGYEPGSPTARGVKDTNYPFVTRRAEKTLAEATELLKTPPSEGVQNLARLFGFEAEDIPQMSQQAALFHRRRLLSVVPDYATQQEAGPLRLLLERLDQQILRFR
jgi:hypothetical protein